MAKQSLADMLDKIPDTIDGLVKDKVDKLLLFTQKLADNSEEFGVALLMLAAAALVRDREAYLKMAAFAFDSTADTIDERGHRDP